MLHIDPYRSKNLIQLEEEEEMVKNSVMFLFRFRRNLYLSILVVVIILYYI